MEGLMDQEKVLESYLDGLLLGGAQSYAQNVTYRDLPVLPNGSTDTVERTESPVFSDEQKPAPAECGTVDRTVTGYDAEAEIGTTSVELDRDNQAEAKFIHIQPLSVVGLKLAIPTDRVNAIVPWPEGLDSSDSSDEGVGGTHLHNGQLMVIVDTAARVVPVDHPNRAVMDSRKCYRYIVLLDEGAWGIACDEIDEDIYVPRQQVHWRSAASSHAWLAGTISEYGYALIDVDRIIEKL